MLVLLSLGYPAHQNMEENLLEKKINAKGYIEGLLQSHHFVTGNSCNAKKKMSRPFH